MIEEFYKRALPSQGVYCVADIDPLTKQTRHKFVENIKDLVIAIEDKNKQDTNVFVAMSSFDGYSRKADKASYVRSFFVDLDVGDGKGYDSKQEALDSLSEFVDTHQFPIPVTIDSGTGVHAYWFLDQDVPAKEWKPYATKFKDFCLNNGLHIDPVVSADLARILRSPDTFNHKTNPPSPTKVIFWDDAVCSFQGCKEFLGEIEVSLEELVKKPITALAKQMNGLNNYGHKFSEIANKSLDDEPNEGCAQIAYIIRQRKNLPEPLWYAGLSIAQHCIDRDDAIHGLSQDYPGYNKEVTERKATQTQDMPHSCISFDAINPGVCGGCSHQGKITNPLTLGKVFISSPSTDTPLKSELKASLNGVPMVTTRLHGLPVEFNEFKRGTNGGIVFKPAPVFDANGDKVEQKEETVTTYDLYPLKRIFSIVDGDCMLMKTDLPNDKAREFLLPFSVVYDGNELRKTLARNGVLFNPITNQWKYIMSYVVKWGQYLVAQGSAEVMRTQMGWTPERDAFVVGDIEINKKGKELSSPTSPLCKGIAKHLMRSGDYKLWKEAANKLNTHGLEVHAFVMLTGLSSILMPYTSTSGVTISLTGDTGAGKTGALYASLSMWGHPKDMSVLDATENGMTGRYLGLHNIPFGLDEVGNTHGRVLSQLIHKVSQGKAKIRMQASVNAERDHELSAALIAIFTTNHSLYDKLSALKKDPNGEVARLIEFFIRKPKLIEDKPSEGRAIFNTFITNHGWAGPEFVKALFKYSDDDIEQRIDVWINKFKKDFGDDTAFRFYENLVAVTMVAGEIADEADIVHIDLDRVYDKIVSEMIDIRENVVKTNNVNYQSLITEFIQNNTNSILEIDEGKVIMEPRHSLLIRLDMDKKELCLSKSPFRKFLIEENNTSPKQFVYQMKQNGTTIVEKRKKMASNWKPGLDEFNVDAYIIDIDTLEKTILKEIDPAIK